LRQGSVMSPALQDKRIANGLTHQFRDEPCGALAALGRFKSRRTPLGAEARNRRLPNVKLRVVTPSETSYRLRLGPPNRLTIADEPEASEAYQHHRPG
jgi:hypothetical protein